MEEWKSVGNDRFRIIKQLGGGGMGVVYAAEDTLLGTRVALKTLRNADMESLVYLKREFRSLQDLQHANLISFGELFENQGNWFFTMELVDGVDLLSYVRTEQSMPGSDAPQAQDDTVTSPQDENSAFDRLESTEDASRPVHKKRFPAFDEGRLRNCLYQLVKGLMALHAADMLHRDIKPGNIMVDASGRVVLMDFGLVTESALEVEELASLFPVGTAGYMSPEQAASQPLTYASDWYSVGVVLFQALTGHLPFEGSFSSILYQKQGQEAPSASDYVLGLPEDLVLLCRDLLRFESLRRPSGPEIIKRLKGAPPIPTLSLEKSISQGHFFTGRESERARLLQFYEQYVSGRDEAVLIHGASGLGKSELVRNFLQNHIRGQERTIVLTGRCYETESVSFKAFDPIIDKLSQFLAAMPSEEIVPLLPPTAGHLTTVFPVLGRVKQLETAEERSEDILNLSEYRVSAFLALRQLLSRLAERYAVVIHIDNFQWADEDSMKLLRTLMLPPSPPHIFFIIAQRTNTLLLKQTRKEVQQTLSTVPVHTRALEVGPLSLAESEDLARKILSVEQAGKNISPEALTALAQESGGHPLFVHELARSLATTGTARRGEAPTLDDVLWERVESLEKGPREIVHIASLSAAPVNVGVLSTVLKIPLGTCIRHINMLRVATLIAARGRHTDRRVEPFHDRVREAVIQRLDPQTARRWHQTLAQAYKESGSASPDILAYHFEAAGISNLARIHYVRAADVASASLAFERASALFKKALELWPEGNLTTDTKKRAVVYDLARALANAGRGQEAAHTFLELVPGALAAEQMRLQRLAGDILLRSGHITEGMQVMEKVLKTIHVFLPRQGWPTVVSLLWHRFRLRLRGLSFKSRDESQISQETLERLDILHSLCDGMGLADHLLGADLSTRWILASLKVGEPRRVLLALHREATYVAAAGNGDSAYEHRLLDAIHGLRQRVDNPTSDGWAYGTEAYQAFMLGKWRESYEKSALAMSRFSPTNSSYWETSTLHFVLLWSSFYLGDLTNMEQLTRPSLHDAMDRGDMLAASGNILGLNTVVFIREKGPEKARDAADWVIGNWSTSTYHLQHYWHLLAHLLIDHFTGAQHQAFERLRDAWRPLKKSHLLLLPSIRHEALYLRSRGFLSEAMASQASTRTRNLKRALKDAERLIAGRLEWPRALGRIIKAEALRLRGEEESSITLLRQTIESLESLEMHFYLAAVQRKLAGILGGDEGAALADRARGYFVSQNIGSADEERYSRMIIP